MVYENSIKKVKKKKNINKTIMCSTSATRPEQQIPESMNPIEFSATFDITKMFYTGTQNVTQTNGHPHNDHNNNNNNSNQFADISA